MQAKLTEIDGGWRVSVDVTELPAKHCVLDVLQQANQRLCDDIREQADACNADMLIADLQAKKQKQAALPVRAKPLPS